MHVSICLLVEYNLHWFCRARLGLQYSAPFLPYSILQLIHYNPKKKTHQNQNKKVTEQPHTEGTHQIETQTN